MANQDAAFGLRPLKTVGQQDDSTGMSQYNIVPGDASVIFQGTVVKAVAGGYADLAADGDGANLGAFWGCFYDDPTTQKPTFKNFYPGGITPANSGAIECFVYDSPMQMFEVQSDNAGASAQADVFSSADTVGNANGSTLNGVSSMELDDSDISAALKQLKIIGPSRDPKNSDITQANVNWRVQLSEHILAPATAGV